jgi:DNA-binding winged helix-turn-helix (wHTH) protein
LAKRDRRELRYAEKKTAAGGGKSFETPSRPMNSAGPGTVRFGECELDLTRRELRRAGEPCHLTPRAFALLELLVAERPRALAKATLRERLWPETYVSNTALAQLVTELRKAIGDEPREGRWIRTVFGFGYAFAGEAEEEKPPAAEEPKAVGPTCWLRWRRQLLPLVQGDNVVGRGREADVRIAVPEVSRRHARIQVAGDRVSIEDLESRNGTTVRGRAVHRPTALADGDEVGFGPEQVVFCSASGGTTTRATRKRGR